MRGDYKIDSAVIERVQAMCEESLDPDLFEQWELVKNRLYENRSSLNNPQNCDVGMYAINSPLYPQVKVGEFIICKHDDASVWIQRGEKEGGQFQNTSFESTLKKFWNDFF